MGLVLRRRNGTEKSTIIIIIILPHPCSRPSFIFCWTLHDCSGRQKLHQGRPMIFTGFKTEEYEPCSDRVFRGWQLQWSCPLLRHSEFTVVLLLLGLVEHLYSPCTFLCSSGDKHCYFLSVYRYMLPPSPPPLGMW